MLVMLNDAVPEFESVTVWAGLVLPRAWLPNARAVSERLAIGEPPVEAPVPLRLTVCGLPVALSLTLSVALLVPLTVGENVTLMVQLAPRATELPQLVVWAKSLLFDPVMAMLVMLKEDEPLLVSVTGWDGLVVPTC